LEASSDGDYLLATGGDHVLAYDLQKRQPISLGGKLKDLQPSHMTFIGSNELFYEGDTESGGLRHGLLMSFPDGKLIKDIVIGDQYVEGVTKGEALVAWPLKGDAVGLVDLSAGKIVAETQFPAFDLWDKFVASEDLQGGLQLGDLSVADSVRIPLPVGPLPNMRAAAFSSDGHYVALSLRNRSAVWQLETGKQTHLMRPFRSAWIDEEDRMWGQYPKYLGRDPMETQLALNSSEDKNFGKYDNEDWQYRDLQFRLKPMGKDKDARSHATLEVKKMETQAVAWSRDYPHETPACWQAEDNRMVLAWDLSNDTARAEIKGDEALQREAQALKNKNRGMLIETVNPETGAPYQKVLIPESDLSSGWDDVRRAMVSGQFVLVHGEHSNTVIYRIDTGEKVGEFFGTPLATDSATGLIAAVNREDEILLVDERSGKEIERFTLGSPARLARIVSGKKLLVLTADQVVHQLPLPESQSAAR
jgi:hypothetical protein